MKTYRHSLAVNSRGSNGRTLPTEVKSHNTLNGIDLIAFHLERRLLESVRFRTPEPRTRTAQASSWSARLYSAPYLVGRREAPAYPQTQRSAPSYGDGCCRIAAYRENAMAFIRYLAEKDIPQSDRVPDRDNIIQIHGVHARTMRHHYELYTELMRGPGPLTRAQREMIAVVVSSRNGCHY